MNLNAEQAKELAENVKRSVKNKNLKHEIVLAPVSVHLLILDNILSDSEIKISAQNVSEYDEGAHTGEVSASQLADLNCDYVIVGHSERRQDNYEKSAQVAKKSQQVIDNKMLPIICVGETIQEKERGDTEEVLRKQVQESIPDIKTEKFIVAYEPVWAIGSGKIPTMTEIESAAKIILDQLNLLKSFENNALILYGGSVKSTNCKEIMQIANISGLLIGGASLKAEEFTKIIELLN